VALWRGGRRRSIVKRNTHLRETAMADTIRRVSYYYTTISDKPGEGARLLDT